MGRRGAPAARGSHGTLVLALRAMGRCSGEMRDVIGAMKEAGLGGDWDAYEVNADRLEELARTAGRVQVPDGDLRRHWRAMLAAAEGIADAWTVTALVACSDQYVAAHRAMQARCDDLVADLTGKARGDPGGP